MIYFRVGNIFHVKSDRGVYFSDEIRGGIIFPDGFRGGVFQNNERPPYNFSREVTTILGSHRFSTKS